MTMKLPFTKWVVVLVLTILAGGLAWAQSDTARLQGTVTDQNDAVVPGATVMVTNEGTARQVSVTTNELGYYTVAGLPPGQYHVEVAQKGFKKLIRDLKLEAR